MNRMSWVIAIGVFVVAGAAAQEPAAREGEPEGWDASVELRTALVEGGELDEGDGELDTWINESKLRVQGWAWRGGRLGFTIGHEHRRYDFEGGQPFFPALDEPWRDVHTVNLGVQLLQAFSREWAVFFGVIGKASAAVDADLGDGVSGLFLGGIGHDFGNGFRLGVGAVALARFEDDFRVFPAIQFDWKINEEWQATLEGLRFDLRYRPVPEWSFGVGAEIDGVRFRLADTGRVGHGIVEDKRLSAFLRIGWQPNETLEIALEGGLDLWRQIDVTDENGDEGDTFKSGTAPFVSLGLTLRF